MHINHAGHVYDNINIVNERPPLIFRLDRQEQKSNGFNLNLSNVDEMVELSAFWVSVFEWYIL